MRDDLDKERLIHMGFSTLIGAIILSHPDKRKFLASLTELMDISEEAGDLYCTTMNPMISSMVTTVRNIILKEEGQSNVSQA